MGKKCKWNRFVLVLVVIAMLGFAQGANAQQVDVQFCPDPLPSLITGPKDPINGFPLWIMDQNGLALQICLEAANCFFDVPIPGNQFSENIGFGPEAFWWLAGATIDPLVGGGRAVLTLGAEAAWAAEVPIDGDQFPFTRLRIRIDTPEAGTYIVTHPYGVDTFEVVDIDAGINVTSDIPLPAPTFGVSHASRIGNFLIGDTTADIPARLIGNQGLTTVTGSNCDTPGPTNIFRIEASNTSGPIDLDRGAGGPAVEQTEFTPQGKIYPRTPTIVDSSTYSRNALGEGQIDVQARALAGATITVYGSTATVEPGGIFNNFFVHTPFADLTTLPATVTVTAVPPGTNPYEYGNEIIISDLTDIVTIARAVYTPDPDPTQPGSLTIVASSSDKFLPPPLTPTDPDDPDAPPLGGSTFTNGIRIVTVGPVPPKTVKVTSAMGGSDTAQVMVVSNPLGVCQGDVDMDGDQDGSDLGLFSIDFGRDECP